MAPALGPPPPSALQQLPSCLSPGVPPFAAALPQEPHLAGPPPHFRGHFLERKSQDVRGSNWGEGSGKRQEEVQDRDGEVSLTCLAFEVSQPLPELQERQALSDFRPQAPKKEPSLPLLKPPPHSPTVSCSPGTYPGERSRHEGWGSCFRARQERGREGLTWLWRPYAPSQGWGETETG